MTDALYAELDIETDAVVKPYSRIGILHTNMFGRLTQLIAMHMLSQNPQVFILMDKAAIALQVYHAHKLRYQSYMQLA